MGMGSEVARIEPPGADESRAVARRDGGRAGGLIRPIAPIHDVIGAQEETRALIQQALVPGRDYGAIPGADRASLWKPGAERIAGAFGCAPHYTILEREVDHDRLVTWRKEKWTGSGNRRRREPLEGTSLGLYRYVVRCELVQRETGVVVGMGHGVCSTLEPKYVEQPRAAENTVLKMAEKRALVDAVLTTFGLSDQFAADLEDQATTAGARRAGERQGAGGAPASTSQLELLRQLMRSHVFTDAERQAVEAKIEQGQTRAQISRAIDRARSAIEARKAAEREAMDDTLDAGDEDDQVGDDDDDELPF